MATPTEARKLATLFDVSTGLRKTVEVGASNAFNVSPEESARGITAWKLETPTQNYQSYKNPKEEVLSTPGSPNLYAGTSVKDAVQIPGPMALSADVNANGVQDTRRSVSFAPGAAGTGAGAGAGAGAGGSAGSGSGAASGASTTGGPEVAKAYNDAIASLLRSAQFGAQDEDLLKYRNELIRERFNGETTPTEDRLRVLSPTQQNSLRGATRSGLEEQLSGVNAAIQARDKARDAYSQTVETFIKTTTAAGVGTGGAKATNEARDDMRASLKWGTDTFGADFIKNMKPEARRQAEEIAGLPEGTLDFVAGDVKTLAEEKAAAGGGTGARYVSIAATKYHPTLIFDRQLGKYVDQNGNPITTPSGAPANPVASGGGTTTKSTPTAAKVLTFEQFVDQKEQAAGMNFANREQFRAEYNDYVAKQKAAAPKAAAAPALPKANWPKGFEASVKYGVSRLQKGESWGVVWNSVKSAYPEVSDATIDAQLGKDQWAKPGAFEEYKQKQFKQTNGGSSDTFQPLLNPGETL